MTDEQRLQIYCAALTGLYANPSLFLNGQPIIDFDDEARQAVFNFVDSQNDMNEFKVVQE